MVLQCDQRRLVHGTHEHATPHCVRYQAIVSANNNYRRIVRVRYFQPIIPHAQSVVRRARHHKIVHIHTQHRVGVSLQQRLAQHIVPNSIHNTLVRKRSTHRHCRHGTSTIYVTIKPLFPYLKRILRYRQRHIANRTHHKRSIMLQQELSPIPHAHPVGHAHHNIPLKG